MTNELESKIHEALYNAELDGVKRYDPNYSGYVFQDVSIRNVDGTTVAVLKYDEVLDTDGLYGTIDGGTITVDDADYDAEQVAQAANDAWDAVDDLAEHNEDHAEVVRGIAGEDVEFRYEVERYITPEVVSDYYGQRLAELNDED